MQQKEKTKRWFFFFPITWPWENDVTTAQNQFSARSQLALGAILGLDFFSTFESIFSKLIYSNKPVARAWLTAI